MTGQHTITHTDAYRAIVRAMLLRHDGPLHIAADELATGPYTIRWRLHADGSLEARLEEHTSS